MWYYWGMGKVRGKFAVFDIDGTLVRWQLYHAVAEALAKAGHIKPEDHTSIRQARMAWKKRESDESFKEYEKKLVEIYEQILQKLTYKQFSSAINAVFDEYKDQVYSYTRNLIKQLKDDGYLLFAVSGSQLEIVGKIAEYWGFDDWVGTDYEHQEGRFTGNITSHIGLKHLVIEQLVTKHNANYKNSLAVGDSEGDISMLEVVESAIAFNPSKKLFDHAKSKGWKIVVERKNVVYELEADNGQYILA